MRKSMLALGLVAALPVAAMAGSRHDINQIVGFNGLGDGSNVTISAGLHTTDGIGEIDLQTGDNPLSHGTVTFILNTAQDGFGQPCLFGYAVGDEFWPLHSQIGFYSTDSSSSSTTMYWRAAELVPNSAYVVKYICPPKTKNPHE